MKPELYMVFDVESVGLHGEGFAVGWKVVDGDGKHVAAAEYACDPARADGDDAGRKWIAENVRCMQGYNCASPSHVRSEFWRAWEYAMKQGAVLVADCAWPVEARFLIDCVQDEPEKRMLEGPYPLHDLASVFLAIGVDPTAHFDRLPNELPIHSPAADAAQSARLLIAALKGKQA